MKTLLAILLVAHAGAAMAQYKCTSAGGAVTFQQTPCVGARAEEKLNVVPNGHPVAASGAGSAPARAAAASSANVGAEVDRRMLAGYEKQRQRAALVQAVQAAQADKDKRAGERLDAQAAAHRQFGDDPANAPALRQALADVDSRYRALDQVDDNRVRDAQKALDEFDKPGSTGPAR